MDRSQWGAHLIPARGPVSFSEVTHNQVFVVPRQLSADLRRYIFKRKAFMQQIEQRDIQQFEKNPPPPGLFRSLACSAVPLLCYSYLEGASTLSGVLQSS